MRVILDSNALLISIPKKSKYRPIFDALRKGAFILSVSNDILSEYEEILAIKNSVIFATNIMELLNVLPNVEYQQIYYKWYLIQQDKDDNKFVDCAVAANADFIVTNDRHFKILKNIDFPTVKVTRIEEFLEMVERGEYLIEVK